MQAIELPEEIAKYSEQWVALTDDDFQIIGAGVHVQDAIDAAREAGHQQFRLHYVLPADVRYVPSA